MDPRMRGSAMGERLPSAIMSVSDTQVDQAIEQTMKIWVEVHMRYHLCP